MRVPAILTADGTSPYMQALGTKVGTVRLGRLSGVRRVAAARSASGIALESGSKTEAQF
jgi:hypothetical protein